MYDIIFIGGGISCLYCAYKLLKKNSELSILLIERNSHLGGRTWKEKFSTSNVVVEEEKESTSNIGNMMKMIPNMSGLMNMVSRMNKADGDDDFIGIKKDMDNYLEKELKVDMTQFNATLATIEKTLDVDKP